MAQKIEPITQLESGHQPQRPLNHKNGELLVAGLQLPQRVKQAGGTPCYLYDMALAKQHIDQLRAYLPQQISLFYAVKANPNRDVLAALTPWVDGVDIASGGELQQALCAGFSPEQCGFAGPSKSLTELHLALENGAHLSAESITEVKRILAWAQTKQQNVEFGLRINPQFELRASGMHMGGGAQPFGIDEEQVADVLALLDSNPWARVTGLHIYAGSQCLQVDALLEQYRQSFACFARLQNLFNLPLTRLNLGGGLGVPYFPGNQPLDLEVLGQGLTTLIQENAELVQNKQLILELGRYLMADAGYYVCQVNDIKQSRGETFVMVDGGMHHHLANSGNLGQLLRKNYPVVIGNKLDQPSTDTVNIAGPLCTPLDVVAKQLPCPSIEVGDYVVVLLSGAYGLTASPIGFLSQPEAKELVLF